MNAPHCPHGIPIAEGVVCADCAGEKAALAGADPNTTERIGWIGPGGDDPCGKTETLLWLARDDLRGCRMAARALIAGALVVGLIAGTILGRFV